MYILARLRKLLARLGRRDKLVLRAALHLEELEDRTVPTLLGQQIFPADNPWNEKITNAPVASNSTAVINNIVTSYGDGRIHPDFGQDSNNGNALYGIPYNVVHGNSTPKTTVVIDAYASESDVVPVPLPANPVLEGDYQNGPLPGLANRGDSHLIVYDVDNNIAYEFYKASRPSENTDGKWHAAQETVWNMKTNTFRTLGWTSADAAGLSILAGLVRPDEGLPVSQGGQGAINHAIRFTLKNSLILNEFLYPASHNANPGNTNAGVQPPMGARFRLKAGVDLTQLNPESRVIAQAMKDYGLILADNGSNFFFSGASYAVDASDNQTLTWNDSDIQDTLHGLKSLHFSDFEMVDLKPVVTDLSVHTGAAGTSVTVIGQNFSGAAGHLQVLFGNTPSASVQVIDDTHVVAVAPAGSGAVDVRVQSGATTTANSHNVTSPIFGYGVSVVSAGDRFTYGTAGTLPGNNNSVPLSSPPAPTQPSPSVSLAVTAGGTVWEVVDATGTLTQFDATGAHPLLTGVRSASVAFGPIGEVLGVVFQNGSLVQLDSAGQHLLGGGVLTASVAFGPVGEVLELVSQSGVLTQLDASGAHPLASGVSSTSVAFTPFGEVLEVVSQSGVLTQLDANGAHSLLSGVISANVAFGPTGMELLDVIFSNGDLVQLDSVGQHLLSKLF